MIEYNATVEEVAAELQRSPYTVRKMARTNKLPAGKVGQEWRFNLNEVRRIVALRGNKWAQSNAQGKA